MLSPHPFYIFALKEVKLMIDEKTKEPEPKPEPEKKAEPNPEPEKKA